MLDKEKINKQIERAISSIGLAINIYTSRKMWVTYEGEKGYLKVIDPVSSMLLSFIFSFILGCFLNTYTINHIFLWTGSYHSIHWILGGILAIVPKIGRYTILCSIVVFLINNFIL